MCGIFGIASSNLLSGEVDVFQKLLWLNYLRGQDSTGIAREDTDGKVHVQKSLLGSPAFILEKPEIIEPTYGKKKHQPRLLMGHCRAATKGAITLKNAHPFRFEKTIGFHNGTLVPPYSNKEKFETDSEALFFNIETMGLEKALGEIQDYTSAYALMWIDLETNRLNFVKNDKRPLAFCYLSGGQTLVWSSDQNHLLTAIKYSILQNPSITGWDKENGKTFTLKENQLLSIEIGKNPLDTRKLTELKIEKKTTIYSVPAIPRATYTPPPRVTGEAGGSTTRGTSAPTAAILPGARTSQVGVFARSPDGSFRVRSTNEIKTATKERSKSVESPAGDYEDFSKRFSNDSLRRLDWLLVEDQTPPWDEQPLRADDEDGEEPGNSDSINDLFDKEESIRHDDEGTLYVRGFQGREIKENEMRYRLRGGCFCCGSVFSLDDPHDFYDINHLHWASDTDWCCDDCYKNSEGDWARLTTDFHGLGMTQTDY